jgi:hypothetical protein
MRPDDPSPAAPPVYARSGTRAIGKDTKGWMRCEVTGRTDDGKRVSVLIQDDGDPGNRITTSGSSERDADRGEVIVQDMRIFEAPSTSLRCPLRSVKSWLALLGNNNVSGRLT